MKTGEAISIPQTPLTADEEGLLLEAAIDLGMTELWSEDGDRVVSYVATEAQMLEFARRVRRAG